MNAAGGVHERAIWLACRAPQLALSCEDPGQSDINVNPGTPLAEQDANSKT